MASYRDNNRALLHEGTLLQILLLILIFYLISLHYVTKNDSKKVGSTSSVMKLLKLLMTYDDLCISK